MEAHPFGRLLPALAARRLLLRAVRPIERIETVAVEEAFGRIAARALRAPRDVPAFARATWDGYALRSADVRGASRRRPRELRIVGEVFAEGHFAGRLGVGEAVAIATGGSIPRGADAVEIFEEVDRVGSGVRLRAPVPAGARISPAGDDLRRGSLLVRAGDRFTPAVLGGVAASGVGTVDVYARPVITIVPNGNELRRPGDRTRPGEIFESNNAALCAVLTASGCEPRPQAPAPDDPRRLERTLRAALRSSDMVLSTGGSSVGERDHLGTVFPRLGRPLFHGIAVRPGKPTLAVRAEGRLVIGLPGHPTSCLLNMHWLVLPVLRRLARLPGPGWTTRTMRLVGAAAVPTPGLATVVPLQVLGPSVRSTFRGSSSIRSLRNAPAFAILPAGRTAVRPGARLRVHLLDPPLGDAATR